MKSLFSLVIWLFSIQQAQSFTLNSPNNPNLEGWANSEVQLFVNLTNCPVGVDVRGLLAEAADVWNHAATSSVKVSIGPDTASTMLSAPTTVYCEVNFQAVTGANQNMVPGAAAIDGSTGRITRGILYLNASSGQGNIGSFNRDSLKIILAHEIGHVLGLGHSEDPSALMYFSATAKKELRLSQDDIDGISYLYPSDEFNGDKLAGCGTVKGSLPPSSLGEKGLFVLVFGAPLFLLLALRLRPRMQPLSTPSTLA